VFDRLLFYLVDEQCWYILLVYLFQHMFFFA
jgi:hypothetical protein